MTTEERLSPTPKRYDCGNGGGLGGYCYGCYQMEQEELGDYVRWEDYEALASRAAALLELAKQYASECANCGGTGRNQYTFPLPSMAMAQVGDPCEACDDIRAVIAKAEGRSHD